MLDGIKCQTCAIWKARSNITSFQHFCTVLILLVKFAIMRKLVLNFIAMFDAALLKLIYDMGAVYERIICPYNWLDMIYQCACQWIFYCTLNFQVSTKRMNEETGKYEICNCAKYLIIEGKMSIYSFDHLLPFGPILCSDKNPLQNEHFSIFQCDQYRKTDNAIYGLQDEAYLITNGRIMCDWANLLWRYCNISS